MTSISMSLKLRTESFGLLITVLVLNWFLLAPNTRFTPIKLNPGGTVKMHPGVMPERMRSCIPVRKESKQPELSVKLLGRCATAKT
jgi:hypothetical protein